MADLFFIYQIFILVEFSLFKNIIIFNNLIPIKDTVSTLFEK